MQQKPNILKIAGIIFLGLSIIVISFFSVRYYLDIRSGADPTLEPKNITIANLSDKSASVFWQTPSCDCLGYIKYGTDPASLDKLALDVRDSGDSNFKAKTHLVQLVGLSPSKNIYYEIYSESDKFSNNGSPYSLTTLNSLSVVQTPNPIKGTVDPTSGNMKDTIVTASITSTKDTSLLLAVAVSSTGGYTFDLSNFRTNEGSKWDDYNNSVIKVEAFSGNNTKGSVSALLKL